MSIESLIPLETKCSWFDDHAGKNLTGWVVIVPAEPSGYYTMSTKYKKATWDKDDKVYWKQVLGPDLKRV
jgi:hypothetical protein